MVRLGAEVIAMKKIFAAAVLLVVSATAAHAAAPEAVHALLAGCGLPCC
jgi:hypothetical protein